jgi:4-hydroxy-3-methylbut-2-enyl diphosphate reductase
MGIETISLLPEKGNGICIIRSHGESDKTFNEIKEKGYEIVDLTCLDVKKVQSKAVEMVSEGYFVIILGKVRKIS